MLANNKTEYILEVTKCSEKTEMLLKQTTEKTDSQEGRFRRNFLDPLMKFGLSLMKNVLLH